MESTGSVIDEINKPPHYTKGGIQPIDFIEANDLDWHEGNIIKYVVRYPHKGTPLKDLMKVENASAINQLSSFTKQKETMTVCILIVKSVCPVTPVNGLRVGQTTTIRLPMG